MQFALGIDTGGTYTDAALVEYTNNRVVASAKALTTYYDLSEGITKAIASVLDTKPTVSIEDIIFVSLSTTLATNSLVEGRGSPVCLMLLGYDANLIEQYGFEHELVTVDVHYVCGGHNDYGNEKAPLDESKILDIIHERCNKVDAFAVSGYFSVRNPAHEKRVRTLVQEETLKLRGSSLPVTCAHELTSNLNSIRRATTVALNAGLIPLLKELISTVRNTLTQLGIDAPLMIVRGDGSLVRSEWALLRPIETILSGPAASAIGAWKLSGCNDVAIVDMGGTTTDVVLLHQGKPSLNTNGVRVGKWSTMVKAIDVYTVGLGGDSEIKYNGKEGLKIGPRRVIPLSILAKQYPFIIDKLREQIKSGIDSKWLGQFVMLQQKPCYLLSDHDKGIFDHISLSPIPLYDLIDKVGFGALTAYNLEKFEQQRLIMRSSFTPTDALHILERVYFGKKEAALLGAELIIKQNNLAIEDFAMHIIEKSSDLITSAVIKKLLQDEEGFDDWVDKSVLNTLMTRAFGWKDATDLFCNFTLMKPIVAIGAPVDEYFPRVTTHLHTDLIIPTNANVANAVGAVAGSISQQINVLIRPFGIEDSYRLHTPFGIEDFSDIETAVKYAEQKISEHLQELTRQAGADQVEIHILRADREITSEGHSDGNDFVVTELTFIATGRPCVES